MHSLVHSACANNCLDLELFRTESSLIDDAQSLLRRVGEEEALYLVIVIDRCCLLPKSTVDSEAALTQRKSID